MKRVIVVLVGLTVVGFAVPGFGSTPYRYQVALCGAVADSRPSAWVVARLGGEFFEQEDVQAVTSYGVARRSVFIKGRDQRVYLVSRWQDFDPQKTYIFSIEWIDPEGRAYRRSVASLRTPSNLDPGIFFTYTAYLDLRDGVKAGQWRVHLWLNGDLVETRDLVISSS